MNYTAYYFSTNTSAPILERSFALDSRAIEWATECWKQRLVATKGTLYVIDGSGRSRRVMGFSR